MELSRVFTLIEPGPVVLVTTCDGNRNNIMTISWTMVLDFSPVFAITTGAWNYSFAALQRTRECVVAVVLPPCSAIHCPSQPIRPA
jgi:flavin reductase (DIM6/NTAB) family NADH-FMN oxidoreductase RutF